MHTIVTGEINAGKTARLIELFKKRGSQGDGFAALKVMQNGRVRFYEALRFSTGETALLAVHHEDTIDCGAMAFAVGPYRFKQTTVDWIRAVCQEVARRNACPLYFDEIGKIELAGRGFDSTVRILVQTSEAVFVVRRSLLQHALEKYGFDEPCIIEVERK